MKKILIIGLTERMGGVETFIYNTTLFSDKTRYKIDFLAHGTKAVLFEKEINAFYGDKNHFFFVDFTRQSSSLMSVCQHYIYSQQDIQELLS